MYSHSIVKCVLFKFRHLNHFEEVERFAIQILIQNQHKHNMKNKKFFITLQ